MDGVTIGDLMCRLKIKIEIEKDDNSEWLKVSLLYGGTLLDSDSVRIDD